MRVPGALSTAGVDPIVVTRWSPDARRRGIPMDTAQLLAGSGGAEGGRTPDLLIANEALSQLSYGPAKMQPCRGLLRVRAIYGPECKVSRIAGRGGPWRRFHRLRRLFAPPRPAT